MTHMIARPTLDGFQQRFFDMAAPVLELARKPVDIFNDRLGVVVDMAAAHNTNEELRAENEKLKEWYQAALMLESENRALRDLLNVDNDNAKKFITTRIIADGSSSYAKSLVIDGGKESGVIKGQGVVSHEGLIGRVIESGARTSRVLLLQDINSRIPVLVEGNGTRAILAGTNDATPSLDHLARDHKVNPGQRVITSGLGGLFPYGIPVGETILGDDGEVLVQLYAAPERSQHIQVVDYGIKPLLSDPIFAAAARNERSLNSFVGTH